MPLHPSNQPRPEPRPLPAASHDLCIVYRTGGRERFQWHRSLAMTEKEAIAAKERTEKLGYKAMVEHYSRSVAVGLPTTYDLKED